MFTVALAVWIGGVLAIVTVACIVGVVTMLSARSNTTDADDFTATMLIRKEEDFQIEPDGANTWHRPGCPTRYDLERECLCTFTVEDVLE